MILNSILNAILVWPCLTWAASIPKDSAISENSSDRDKAKLTSADGVTEYYTAFLNISYFDKNRSRYEHYPPPQPPVSMLASHLTSPVSYPEALVSPMMETNFMDHNNSNNFMDKDNNIIDNNNIMDDYNFMDNYNNIFMDHNINRHFNNNFMDHNNIQDLRGVMDSPEAMFRSMGVDNMTGISNRRMDTGLEDYEYVDTDGDSELVMEITDNTIKDSVNEEEIDRDESGDDGDIDQANKVSFINQHPDTEEDDDKMEDIPHTTARSTELLSPRPVYVVYPDTEPTATTTENTSATATTGNLKMFDIEYDQFS